MTEFESNTTHVEYAEFLPGYSERLKLRELMKVPSGLGRMQEGWA
jgi:hypothetical protein